MKKMKLIKGLLMLTFIATIPLLNSCADENIIEEQEANKEVILEKYTKEVVIYGNKKQNSIVLKLGSNDQSVLDLWSADNFSLNLLNEGEDVSKLITLNTYVIAKNSENEEVSEGTSAEISYRIIQKNITEKGKRLILIENPPYSDDVRAWKYSTYYSDQEVGNTVTVNIYGHNFWKRGFYSVSYKRTSTSGWSTIASEWTRIRNNETKTYTRTPCYYMKARRKYKGSNNSVIIEFEY